MIGYVPDARRNNSPWQKINCLLFPFARHSLWNHYATDFSINNRRWGDFAMPLVMTENRALWRRLNREYHRIRFSLEFKHQSGLYFCMNNHKLKIIFTLIYIFFYNFLQSALYWQSRQVSRENKIKIFAIITLKLKLKLKSFKRGEQPIYRITSIMEFA